MMKRNIAFLALSLASAGLTAQAQGPGGPPVGAGETIQSLAQKLTAVTSRVTALEGEVAKLKSGIVSAAELVGTWDLHGFQNEMRPWYIASYVPVGTLVLAADGSGTISVSEAGHSLGFGPPRTVVPFVGACPNGCSGSFNWTYGNGVITTTGDFAGTLKVGAGGRVLVTAGANSADNTNVLLILTKRQP